MTDQDNLLLAHISGSYVGDDGKTHLVDETMTTDNGMIIGVCRADRHAELAAVGMLDTLFLARFLRGLKGVFGDKDFDNALMLMQCEENVLDKIEKEDK